MTDSLYTIIKSLCEDLNSDSPEVRSRSNQKLKTLCSKLDRENKTKLFFIKHEDKPFYKTLVCLCKGFTVLDADLAISLSSLLTYSLIEVKNDPRAYFYLDIETLSTLINKFVKGDCPQSDIITWVKSYEIL